MTNVGSVQVNVQEGGQLNYYSDCNGINSALKINQEGPSYNGYSTVLTNGKQKSSGGPSYNGYSTVLTNGKQKGSGVYSIPRLHTGKSHIQNGATSLGSGVMPGIDPWGLSHAEERHSDARLAFSIGETMRSDLSIGGSGYNVCSTVPYYVPALTNGSGAYSHPKCHNGESRIQSNKGNEELLWTIKFLIPWTIRFLIPTIFIIFGLVHINGCAAEFRIPLCAFGIGSIILMWQLLAFCTDSKNIDKDLVCPLVCFYFLLFVSFWCLFFATCVWVYRTTPEFENVDASNYCNKTLYNFMFWVLNSTFILASFLILGCVLCYCANC